MFSFDSKVRYSEVDEDQYLKIVSMINYMQDCSTFHSEAIGVGVEHLKAHEFAWVLAQSRVEVIQLPRYCDHITINTWCYELKRFTAKRAFTICLDDGSVAVVCDSLWSTFNTSLGRAMSVPESENVYLSDEEPPKLKPLERKIKLGDEVQQAAPIVVCEHHLDTNKHVNNAQYVQMAIDALESCGMGISAHEISAIDSQYRMQARLGDVIQPLISKDKSAFTISLRNEADEAITNIRLVCS